METQRLAVFFLHLILAHHRKARECRHDCSRDRRKQHLIPFQGMFFLLAHLRILSRRNAHLQIIFDAVDRPQRAFRIVSIRHAVICRIQHLLYPRIRQHFHRIPGGRNVYLPVVHIDRKQNTTRIVPDAQSVSVIKIIGIAFRRFSLCVLDCQYRQIGIL